MLNVYFVCLIARPRAIQSRQKAFACETFPIFFVGVIALLALRSEEEPVFSFCAESLPLLQKCAERRDASARSNHDQRQGLIFRHVKMFRRTGINRHRNFVRAFRQKIRRHALSRAATTFVSHNIDNQVHLVGKDAQAGSNRVQSRLQFRQQPDKFLGSQFDRRMLEQEIDYLGAPKIIFEIVFTVRAQQLREHRRS